jgi:hypothetical protein
MVDEDGVERLQHEGRVFRWGRRGSAWPGHTTFVAIRAGEVVVGDRYAGEGVERTYACHPQALLEGCFQALVTEQLGPRVLAELLAEVRRELGVRPGATAASEQAATPQTATKNAHGSTPAAVASPTPAATGSATPSTKNARGSVPAAVASPTPVTGSHAPAAAASQQKAVSAHSGAVEPTEPVAATARVDVAVVACRAVDLPLAVALRGITRAPVQELLGRLRSLPCRVAAGVPVELAEALAARLAELGAEVRLVPARAS